MSEDIHKRKLTEAILRGLGRDTAFIERRRDHYYRVMQNLFYQLDQETIWSDEKSEGQLVESNITVGGSITNSTIILGDRNQTKNIPKPARKRKT